MYIHLRCTRNVWISDRELENWFKLELSYFKKSYFPLVTSGVAKCQRRKIYVYWVWHLFTRSWESSNEYTSMSIVGKYRLDFVTHYGFISSVYTNENLKHYWHTTHRGTGENFLRGAELKLLEKFCFIKICSWFGRRLSFCHLFLPTS